MAGAGYGLWALVIVNTLLFMVLGSAGLHLREAGAKRRTRRSGSVRAFLPLLRSRRLPCRIPLTPLTASRLVHRDTAGPASTIPTRHLLHTPPHGGRDRS